MRLSVPAQDLLVDTFADRLTDGALHIYPGARASAEGALIEIPFSAPAFAPAVDGRAVAYPLPSMAILRSGTATWAALVTDAGDVLADLLVRAVDDPEASEADLVLDRVDFHRGGLCTITRLSLTLPAQS